MRVRDECEHCGTRYEPEKPNFEGHNIALGCVAKMSIVGSDYVAVHQGPEPPRKTRVEVGDSDGAIAKEEFNWERFLT
jgi:hypothetical protein